MLNFKKMRPKEDMESHAEKQKKVNAYAEISKFQLCCTWYFKKANGEI